MSERLYEQANHATSRSMQSPIVIIGIGNAFCGDDAVGLIVARMLREKPLLGVRVIEAGGDATTLVELWKDADAVILIDAVRSGARPGTIYRIEAHAEPIPTSFARHSTHAFGAAEAIELARALDQLPSRLILFGIEGHNFDAGADLSPEVEIAARNVVTRISRELCHYPGKL